MSGIKQKATEETKKGPCGCWNQIDDKLREKGFKFHPACSALTINTETGALGAEYGIPLRRVDGKKIAKSDPLMMAISFCPFCGRSMKDEAKGGAK